ncbi:ribonuclease H-like domain-containing protein [Thermosulfurimonas sp. F29]|uniref:ribonuclease H-like domain-containing protein n=1 Tax=Thermosulfurimonas sp. F29 TaxID=2867247 RepID=UPI001C82DEDE|nr:ribonuclease H-like domain-containing protein [Thermosulfurimonas sp. F29]MBX6424057.1 ribonuclease H-like domain-containing protein [Thermosulfurimonas sp. F29]
MIPDFLLAELPESMIRVLRDNPEGYVIFLDIETEGLSRERNGITVLGTMARGRYRAFVAGFNLEKGAEFLAAYPVWVTFGGTRFDLPFLRARFPALPPPLLHIDLEHLYRRLGYRGGLKKLEERFGLVRNTRGLTGYDAVKLWQRWKRERDRAALRRLLLYNREDVTNLKPLLERAGRMLKGFTERNLRSRGGAIAG